MRLVDLRQLSIRKQFKIHFKLRNGMECIVTEHGVAQVPALTGVPDFNLEEELAAAGEFLIESAIVVDKKTDRKNLIHPRSVSRSELAKMTSASPAASAGPEHDDE